MSEDKGQREFRTLGDEYRARRRLRRDMSGLDALLALCEAYDKRQILTDDGFAASIDKGRDDAR